MIITAETGRGEEEAGHGFVRISWETAPASLCLAPSTTLSNPNPIRSCLLSSFHMPRLRAAGPRGWVAPGSQEAISVAREAVAGAAGPGPEEELSSAPRTQPLSPGRTSVLGSGNYSRRNLFQLKYRVAQGRCLQGRPEHWREVKSRFSSGQGSLRGFI